MRFRLTLIIVLICFFPVITFSGTPPSNTPIPPTVAPKERGDSRPQRQDGQTTEERKPSKASPATLLQTEVAGFILEGNKPWETLVIQDLDIMTAPSGHLIPLLRLLKALQVEIEEREDILSFNPASSLKIILDIQKKEIQINSQTRSVPLVAGISDLTQKKEVYLPSDVLSEILFMKIEWDDQNYRFVAKTDQKLSIWKITPGASLFAIQTKAIPTNLPELFPPASPRDFSLDFMELQLRPYFTTSGIGSENGSSKKLGIDSPRQTFWGSAFGGRYRLQFSEPSATWDSSGFERAKTALIMLNRGDWTYSLPNSQIAVGDSVFGLNDLTFPTVSMSGVRINGLAGFPVEDKLGQGSPGLANDFITPHVFEGTAPVGSNVELVVNDRSVETLKVSIGTYRFQEVRFAPGSFNIVKIITTEPSGYQTVTEQSIFGRSIHLPKGGLAYLGGLGTNRQINDWDARGIFGGGRALYGVTDSLTVGTTWAAQQHFYLPSSTDSLEADERVYPRSSFHVGGQAAWLPWEFLLLSGDMSLSRGEGSPGNYNGTAYKVRGELYPSQKIQILSQFFRYGPDFFNGENVQLKDREGYVVNGRWNIHRKVWTSSSLGAVWNNLDKHLDDTLRVQFQSLEIGSSVIPGMTLTGGANRISPNWDEGGTLYSLRLQGTPVKNIYFDGFYSRGKYWDQKKESDFFNGLRIPGLLLMRPPRLTASLSAPVTANISMGAAYWEDENRKRVTILNSFRSPGGRIQAQTQLGYDINDRQPFFQNTIRYFFDKSITNYVGLDTRYEQKEWTISLLFNFTQLFSFNRGVPTRVSDSSVVPDRGGVRGRVFIDCNADGKMDPGEPGVGDVTVILGNITKASTDKKGYFILPTFGQEKSSRVFLDIDTVPANYSPTHAIQTVNLKSGTLTEVNFGIAPLNSILGIVQALRPDKGIEPLRGIRVYLTTVTDDKKITDSVSAQDGSYYIGDVRPGKYYLHVDPETLPPTYVITDPKKMIEVLPGREPQELKVAPFISFTGSEKAKGEEKPPAPPALRTAPPADVKTVVLWERSKTAVP